MLLNNNKKKSDRMQKIVFFSFLHYVLHYFVSYKFNNSVMQRGNTNLATWVTEYRLTHFLLLKTVIDILN